jgi:hypothetical protein
VSDETPVVSQPQRERDEDIRLMGKVVRIRPGLKLPLQKLAASLFASGKIATTHEGDAVEFLFQFYVGQNARAKEVK